MTSLGTCKMMSVVYVFVENVVSIDESRAEIKYELNCGDNH